MLRARSAVGDGTARLPAVIRMNSIPKGLAVGAACVGLAACGGSNKTADIPSGTGDTNATSVAPISETTATTPKTSFGKPTAEIQKIADAVGTTTKKKPKIIKPSGKPPAKLTYVDVVPGKGAGAQDGDTLTVDYAGDSWSTGKEFDASWKSGQPFPLTLGQGQ